MKNRILYTLALSFISLSLWSQANAFYMVDIAEGCTPLTVNFTDASEGNNLTYTWDFADGNTSQQQNPTHIFTTPGVYQVCLTVEDGDDGSISNYCAPEAITVNVLSSTYTFTNPTCFGEEDGSICLNDIQCGEAPFSYSWNFGGLTTNCISNLSAGTYVVTITDNNTMTTVESFTLVEPFPIQIDDIAIADVDCQGEMTGAIDILISGGVAPYTFLWSNGVESEDQSNLGAGSYSVTITDANDCEFTANGIIVSEPVAMQLTVIPTEPTCGNADGSFTLAVTGGTAPYLYTWNDGIYTTQDITGLLPGFFNVVVTDANGCTAEWENTLNSAGGATISFNDINHVNCFGYNDGSIDIEVSGGTEPYIYQWNNGETLEDISSLSPNTYIVTVEDANGCLSFAQAEILEPSEVIVTVDNISTDCGNSDGALMVNAEGGLPPYQYVWSNNDMTQVLSGLIQGVYTVSVYDSNGCEGSGSGIVEGGLILDATTTPATCGNGADGSIDLTVSNGQAPYTYVWSNGAITEDLTDLIAASYFVTVTDNTGCTGFLDVEVFEDGTPIGINITGPATVCEGEEIILCGPSSPLITYLWTGPSGFTSTTACISIPNSDISNSGCYTLEITDANGCTGEETFCVTVVSPSDIIVNIALDAFICTSESTQLTAQLGGPTSNYSFSWTPAATLDDPTSLNPIASPEVTTTYAFTATDIASGCAAVESVIVNVIPDCVWPGDTDTNMVVNNFDLLNIGLAYDSVGPVRSGGNLMWMGQPAVDWMQTVPSGPNYKHVDCDGNGVINSNDTLAITGNWGETYGFTSDNPNEFSNSDPTDGGDPAFFVDAPFYVQADTLIEGADMAFPIILGEESNEAEDIYGIAFSLTYDTAYIKESGVSVGFGPSWLGLNNDDMIAIQRNYPEDGRIDIGMTRIDGMNMTDYGQLAQLFITVEDDILFAPEDDPQFLTGGGSDGGDEGFFTGTAVFDIINVKAITSSGEEVTIIPTETTVPVQTTTSANEILPAGALKVYPNPAKDRIHVNTKNRNIENIILFDISGKLIQSTTTSSLDVKNVRSGLYLLKVQTTSGIHIEKIMIE